MASESLGDWATQQAEQGALCDSQAMRVLARRLPKAALHVHFLSAVRRSFPCSESPERLTAPSQILAVASKIAPLLLYLPSVSPTTQCLIPKDNSTEIELVEHKIHGRRSFRSRKLSSSAARSAALFYLCHRLIRCPPMPECRVRII